MNFYDWRTRVHHLDQSFWYNTYFYTQINTSNFILMRYLFLTAAVYATDVENILFVFSSACSLLSKSGKKIKNTETLFSLANVKAGMRQEKAAR